MQFLKRLSFQSTSVRCTCSLETKSASEYNVKTAITNEMESWNFVEVPFKTVHYVGHEVWLAWLFIRPTCPHTLTSVWTDVARLLIPNVLIFASWVPRVIKCWKKFSEQQMYTVLSVVLDILLTLEGPCTKYYQFTQWTHSILQNLLDCGDLGHLIYYTQCRCSP